MDAPTVLFVPGLVEHPPHHWQTLLQNRVDNIHLGPDVALEAVGSLHEP